MTRPPASGAAIDRLTARVRELEAANARLRDRLAAADMLMAEVNHRAKNSLAVAASLLHLRARRRPEAAAAMHDAQTYLAAMAQVHDLLSRCDDGQQVDATTYVTALCTPLSRLAGAGRRIRIAADADDGIRLGGDIAFPLGLMITELVTNAVKHAFPSPRRGTISVALRRAPSGRIVLVVEDDGVGMTAPHEGSLGYGLLGALARQIKGELAIGSERGVRVSLTFMP